MLRIDSVYRAHSVLNGVVRKTTVIPAPALCEGVEMYLKTENLQVTGSFKVRGAYNKIACLTDEEKARGVIACSAGNHAQGVALAAQKSAIKSVICLPDGAPISKIEATKSYGAEVCLVEGVYDDAYKRALELRDEKGYTFIHPFDDEEVIAGQATIALELIEQIPDMDAVLVPVGGGGLVAGIAFTLKTLMPKVKVYGVEATGAASMKLALDSGKVDALPSISTIADGIAVKKAGSLTYELCKEYVDEIVTVSDDEISAAILALMEKHKLVAEGAGAAAVAGAMFKKVDLQGKKVVCLLSGGNIDVTILSRVIHRGLIMSGRNCQLVIELVDKPGQLLAVSKIIAELGGNVTSVYHDREGENTGVNGCSLRILLETRNFEHIAQIKKALSEQGFKLL